MDAATPPEKQSRPKRGSAVTPSSPQAGPGSQTWVFCHPLTCATKLARPWVYLSVKRQGGALPSSAGFLTSEQMTMASL